MVARGAEGECTMVARGAESLVVCALVAVAAMVAGVIWFFIWLFWIQGDPIHALPGICKMVALDSGRALGAACDPGMAWDARSKKCLASPCTVAGTVYNSNSKTCIKDPCVFSFGELWDSQSNFVVRLALESLDLGQSMAARTIVTLD